MPRIYTRTGDKGVSSIYDGTRLPKDDLVFQTLGEMDELTTRIGSLKVYLSQCEELSKLVCLPYTLEFLEIIQQNIQNFNSHIATHSGPNLNRLPSFDADMVEQIEVHIDSIESKTPPLTKFILPGGSELSSRAHLCRTQSRKAERFFTSVKGQLDPDLTAKEEWVMMTQYMNRLSDYFFVLARYVIEGQE